MPHSSDLMLEVFQHYYLVLTCKKLLKNVQDNYHERSENVQSPA